MWARVVMWDLRAEWVDRFGVGMVWSGLVWMLERLVLVIKIESKSVWVPNRMHSKHAPNTSVFVAI